MTKHKYVIGIDEAGRGPLAGPVSVGVACVPIGFNWDVIPGVNDSKKLTEKKREEIFSIAEKLKSEQKLDYAVAMVDAATIDAIGIVPSVKKAMSLALTKIQELNRCDLFIESHVQLDGALTAPSEFISQETIIGGDGKEKVIGLASIMAKVIRDRYMVEIASLEKYEVYGFGVHKGYGTKKHREAIQHNGCSDIHRRSFCTRLIKT